MSRLINIKCEFNLPNRIVDNVLTPMKEMCPPDNEMADTYYSAKKLLAALQIPHKRIVSACYTGKIKLTWIDVSIVEVTHMRRHCGGKALRRKY